MEGERENNAGPSWDLISRGWSQGSNARCYLPLPYNSEEVPEGAIGTDGSLTGGRR